MLICTCDKLFYILDLMLTIAIEMDDIFGFGVFCYILIACLGGCSRTHIARMAEDDDIIRFETGGDMSIEITIVSIIDSDDTMT